MSEEAPVSGGREISGRDSGDPSAATAASSCGGEGLGAEGRQDASQHPSLSSLFTDTPPHRGTGLR